MHINHAPVLLRRLLNQSNKSSPDSKDYHTGFENSPRPAFGSNFFQKTGEMSMGRYSVSQDPFQPCRMALWVSVSKRAQGATVLCQSDRLHYDRSGGEIHNSSCD